MTKPTPDVLYLIQARIDSGKMRGAPQLRKDVLVLRKAAEEIERLRAVNARSWRCYFCDEVFTTQGEAGDHFGATLTDKPGCLIDYRVQVEAGTTTQRGRGLLMALRRAEAELMRYGSEDTDLHRYIHRLQSDHQQALLREEEKGYARGLRDGANLPADSPERAALVDVGSTAA